MGGESKGMRSIAGLAGAERKNVNGDVLEGQFVDFDAELSWEIVEGHPRLRLRRRPRPRRSERCVEAARRIVHCRGVHGRGCRAHDFRRNEDVAVERRA